MMTERDKKFALHIMELAAAFKVRLIVVPDLPPERATSGVLRNELDGTMTTAIKIAPVMDETTYAVALHELGHSIDPLGHVTHVEGSLTMRNTGMLASIRDVRLRIEAERAAWAWARHYALEWTDVMSMVETMAMRTYVKHAARLGVTV